MSARASAHHHIRHGTAAAAAAATSARRSISQPGGSNRLPPGVCYCGQPTEGEHFVYIAFLKWDNPRYQQVFINKVTVWFTGSEYIHVQLAFWNQNRDAYETFSVDAHKNKVWRNREKGFAEGWVFLRFAVTQAEELLMYAFLTRQLGKPYNKWGHRMIALWRMNDNYNSWFCTSLTLAAFQQIGWFLAYNPSDMFPIDIFDLVCAQTHHVSEVGHLVAIQEAERRHEKGIRRQRQKFLAAQRQKRARTGRVSGSASQADYDDDGDGDLDGDDDEEESFDEDQGYRDDDDGDDDSVRRVERKHRRSHIAITIEHQENDDRHRR